MYSENSVTEVFISVLETQLRSIVVVEVLVVVVVETYSEIIH